MSEKMYGIYAEYCYIPGTIHAPTDGMLRDQEYSPAAPNGRIMVLASHEEASRLAEALTPHGTYHLSHGEQGTPSYRVIAMRPGWRIRLCDSAVSAALALGKSHAADELEDAQAIQ